ncbi:MAG: DUF4249 domain-containing protein [Flavobacterium sp.]|uniref:DUF4249 domain-containing protein n=1 Tax=Flavobacterium sp. TaxID=239 RepID=UPI003265A6ED
MKKRILIPHILVIIILCMVGCTEPYALQTNNFENAIVIEATITNEFKKQEIKLSRTYTLEENGPKFETGAIAYIIDNLGNKYDFEENNGKYISTSEFQAIANRNYQLHITTNDGKSYISSNEELTTVNPIQNIVPSVIIKDGIRGVEIKVNSFDPTNTSKYYRYEYDETYKIIAPKWLEQEAISNYFPLGSNPPGELLFQTRTTEAKICFSTEKSKNIILTNTNNLSEDRVNYPVRFISSSDHILINRYSILVKQYVQNLKAYTFYETLKKMSSSGSILSQNQPGYFSGNIKSEDNPNEKVIGNFDVSSYSEKRIFFNYADIFPGEQLPKYPYDCPEINQDNNIEYAFGFCFSYVDPNCYGNEILSWIKSRNKVYAGFYGDKYILYPIQCGDCTSFSNNIRPSFWID